MKLLEENIEWNFYTTRTGKYDIKDMGNNNRNREIVLDENFKVTHQKTA